MFNESVNGKREPAAMSKKSVSFKKLFSRSESSGQSFKRGKESFKKGANAVLGALTTTKLGQKWKNIGSEGGSVLSSNSFVRGASKNESTGDEEHYDKLRSIDDRAYANAKLRKACANGALNQVRLLIDQGASIHSRDEAFERSPLHYAALHGHAEIVRLLVGRGADPKVADLSDAAPLHIAAEHGWVQVVETLVRDCRADLNQRTSNGSIPLHYAAHNNHSGAAELLVTLMGERRMLKAGVDAWGDAKDTLDYSEFLNNWRKSPVDLAIERGHNALARRMLAADAVANLAPPLRSEVKKAAAARAAEGGQAKSRKSKSPAKQATWSGFGPIKAELKGANGKRI